MKRHKPPELPTSLFGWIWPLLKIGDEEMLDNVGLDALLMLKFIAMGIKIFSTCSFFGLTVFLPITLTSNYQKGNTTSLERLSINVIEDDSKKIIAYLVFAYIFTFVTFFYLNQHYNEFIYLRAKHLINQSKTLVARSVIVTGIPEQFRSDKALAEYFENLNIGAVESCYVVRTVYRIETLIKKRANALKRLEEAYAKYWGNPCRIPGYDPDRILDDVEMYKRVLDLAEKRESSSSEEEDDQDNQFRLLSSREDGSRLKSPLNSLRRKTRLGTTTFFKGLVEPTLGLKKGTQSKRPMVRLGLFGLFGKKVDAIEYYTKLFDDLDKSVIEARQSPNYEMTNVAFVTFEEMSSALIASQIAICPEPFAIRTSIACEPRDIIWSSIAIRGRERIVREIIVWTITVFLCITWTVPVFAVSSLISVDTIKKVNAAAGQKIADSPVGHLVFASFIPPLILNIFTSTLPLFFDAMGYHQGLRTRSAVAESTLSKQYFFLIFFTLIFYSIVGTTILTLLSDISNDLKQLPTYLARKLPNLAPFFINYTILQTFLIMPLNLLLLGSIVVRGFDYLFLCSTPREYAENKAPWSFNYGIGYPAPLLVFAIVFEYSLINPLILLFGVVYFCFTYLVYKYQFLYVYFRPYEAAGRLWTMVIPRIIFTLVLFQLTMLGLFLLRGSFILAGLVIPLVVFTFLFRYILNRAYEQNGMNLPLQLLRDNVKSNPPQLSDEESEGSDIDNDEEPSANRAITNGPSSNKSTTTSVELKKQEDAEKKTEIRNRWKKAALSVANLKDPEQPSPTDGNLGSNSVLPISSKENEEKAKEITLIRPRHRKVVLDEDDYEATPERLTDYRQPPMQLNPGLLDAGLKTYGNPLLVGVLPQLWLPVKESSEEERNKTAKKKLNQLEQNRSQEGGSLAQHLAEILRKVEEDRNATQSKSEDKLGVQANKNGQQEDSELREQSRKHAQTDAASIVSGKRTYPKTSVLRSMFQRGAFKQANAKDANSPTPAENFRLQHLENELNDSHNDAAMDSAERGQLHQNNSHTNSPTPSVKSSQSLHKMYYHHPERRHQQKHKKPPGSSFLRPNLDMGRASSPAVTSGLSVLDENNSMEEDMGQPRMRNRLSSDPLIQK
ncbi:Calcium permeable stress-gated cation channel 1 [Choanephora cucurbitarum]|uniref:Calcium permeable stress-gated cation channel 1 n=1 Tax=Choanephora cucurbitarum TaxID=101091 RepID=A0A1C7NGT4_9FUNG|nr:Calcium permeable stress-gated cation channel 1 [Choanephora cucurbitarum]